MKKIIILTLISLAFNSYGQELIFKTNNKSYKGSLKIEQILDEKDIIVNKVCKVQLTNLKPSGSWSAALGYISFNLNDGSKFDFGSVITKTRTSAVFTNANISSSTTYNNGNYYWVHLAIDGFEGSSHNGTDYWLGSSSASQTFTINFNKGESIKSISLKDKATCVTNCRGTKAPYDINLYDCNNNLIKTYTINTQLSESYSTIGTLIFD